MRNASGIYYLNNFAGLNRVGSLYNKDSVWLWDLLNGYIQREKDGRGSIKQRYGISKKNTTILESSTTKIRYLFEAYWNSGGTALIARAYDGWYKFNTTTDEFDALDVTRTEDAKGQAAMWNNGIILVDGGVPRYCSSAYALSDLSDDASMPQDSSAVHVHQFRVWLNSTTYPMKAYGSKVSDATGASAWSTDSDSITLDLSKVLPEGDKILGFRTVGDTMLAIFCRKNIVIYNAPTTYNDISLVQIIPVGCISINGVVSIANDLAYPAIGRHIVPSVL